MPLKTGCGAKALMKDQRSMVPGEMCARVSWCIPVGSSPTQVKLSQQAAAEAASAEVMKLMEPVDRRCWGATQVNVISPEIDPLGFYLCLAPFFFFKYLPPLFTFTIKDVTNSIGVNN